MPFYFPSASLENLGRVCDPFSSSVMDTVSKLPSQMQKQLSEMREHRGLKLKFSEQTLGTFCVNLADEYPLLHLRAELLKHYNVA